MLEVLNNGHFYHAERNAKLLKSDSKKALQLACTSTWQYIWFTNKRLFCLYISFLSSPSVHCFLIISSWNMISLTRTLWHCWKMRTVYICIWWQHSDTELFCSFFQGIVLLSGEPHLCPFVFCFTCYTQCKGSDYENANEYPCLSSVNMIACCTSEWLRKLMDNNLNCGNVWAMVRKLQFRCTAFSSSTPNLE